MAYIVTFILSLVWSSYLIIAKIVVAHVGVNTVGVLVRLVTIPVLLFFLAIEKKRSLSSFQVGDVFVFICMVGIFNFLLNISSFLGLKFTTATNASILFKTDILFTILIGSIFFGERISRIGWCSIALMVAGSFMVVNPDIGNFQFHYLGDLLLVLAALFVAINAFIIKVRLRYISNVLIALYNMIISSALFSIFLFIFGEHRSFITSLNNTKIWIGLLLLGVANASILLLYYYSLQRLPVWTVRTLLLLMPPITVLMGRVFLQEEMDPVQTWGMPLVLIGAGGLIYPALFIPISKK